MGDDSSTPATGDPNSQKIESTTPISIPNSSQTPPPPPPQQHSQPQNPTQTPVFQPASIYAPMSQIPGSIASNHPLPPPPPPFRPGIQFTPVTNFQNPSSGVPPPGVNSIAAPGSMRQYQTQPGQIQNLRSFQPMPNGYPVIAPPETNKAAGKRHALDNQDPKKARTDTQVTGLLTVNQKFLDSLIATGEGGFEVPDEQLSPTLRVYVVNLETLRGQFASVLNQILLMKFVERGDRTHSAATTLATKVSNLCSEVCITAIYAKLQTIHRSIYKERFTTPKTYSKDIELPLPFAIAIENFGLFETSAMTTRYCVVPVYPEGSKNEGCSTDDLNLLEYNSYCSLFAKIGLPTKNIDPHERKGTAWFTYLPTFNGDSYDLKIPYPPLHYSDHSAVIATMFLSHNKETHNVTPIVTAPEGDSDYGWHLKDIRDGDQLRAFCALSQWSEFYWNEKGNV